MLLPGTGRPGLLLWVKTPRWGAIPNAPPGLFGEKEGVQKEKNLGPAVPLVG